MIFAKPTQRSVEDVFEYAELQARVLYHEYLGAEHVLWAILELRDSESEIVLQACDMQPRAVLKRIKRLIAAGPPLECESPLLPQTPRLNSIVALAKEEAQATSDSFRPVHLILAFCRENESVAAQALQPLTAEDVRSAMKRR